MATRAEIYARHGIAVVDELLPETVAMDGRAAVTGAVSAPARETRPADQIPPHDALRNAAHNLDFARWRARQCRDAVAASRQAFNLALNAWNLTVPVQTQQQARQEWIDTNQRERARKAAVGQGIHYANVSQTARALGGGGHNAKRGLGRAYKRGAFSKAEALEINAGKLRAAAAARMNGNIAPHAKLPSQR